MKSLLLALPLLLAAGAAGAFAPPPEQHYRLSGSPDVASELILHADGRFDYFFSAGALDEQAQGRWTRDGETIRLTTEPKPRPAVFTAGAADRVDGGPLAIRVTWPDGRGIAGVDFSLAFDSGAPIVGCTQEDGWILEPSEKRTPRSIAFAVPMHGLRSQPFAIDAAKANRLTFVLTPNDLGIADFENLPLSVGPDRLTMHLGEGDLTYVLQDH